MILHARHGSEHERPRPSSLIINMKNLDLLETWISSPKSEKSINVLMKIQSLLNIAVCTDTVYEKIKKISEIYCLAIGKKWKDCSRNKNYLLQRHHEWLNKEILLSDILLEETSIPSGLQQPGGRRGRPQVSFEEASSKTKRRRVQDLIISRSSDELRLAVALSQGTSNTSNQTHHDLSSQDLIALCLDLDLSERKYLTLRSFINALHTNCFPSVKILRQMKRSFLPSSISVTEISAEVGLQDLLNITTDSILKMVDIEDTINVKLICKWGFDGSSGHSIYKQKFTESSSHYTDEFMFLIAFVPLKLVDIRSNRELWVNCRPSSTFFCRPIKFIFMKENEKLVREQESLMISKIENLSPYIINSGNNNVQIDFQLHFTMLDGSVSNILSNTNATSKCYICGATPKEMNSIRVTEKLPNTDNYRFGLSTLHCWIRFFECLLHICYRLLFKKWQVRGDEHKQIFEHTKKQVQENFKSRLGLIVDKPKPGYGSSNDGNTARKFFINSDISSQITSIDKNLIDMFYLILRVISSGREIDTIKFKTLLQDTRELYLALYNWYYMPSSVHKVLVHGCDIIDSFDLPIGLLSEEALEARHKEIRKCRLHHTRKISREASNRDLINALILSSDPIISNSRKSTSKISRDISDIQEYLLNIDQPRSISSELGIPHNLHLSDTESEDSE